MLSTLSTGLSKSDEFIKDNAINTYVRDLKFNNDVKTQLTEEQAIPASEIPVRRYVRCASLLYPNDIRICHLMLTATVIRTTPQTATITPLQIDRLGLLPALQRELSSIGLGIETTYSNGVYTGCRLVITKNQDTINIVQCNYAFAWMCGIISQFGNKSYSDNLILFRPSQINLLQFPNTGRKASAKIFFPLLNGGINKITVSSDELVTSQYINGFKMATLATVAANSNASIHKVSPPRQERHPTIEAKFTLAHHPDQSAEITHPDDGLTHEFEYYPTILPDRITSFQCSSMDRVFDIVVCKKVNNVVNTYPTNTSEPIKASELRINAQELRKISDQWFLKLRYYGINQDALVVVKTNIRLITDAEQQLTTEVLRSHQVTRHSSINTKHVLEKLRTWRHFDLSLHPTAKYITIRNYCFQLFGYGGDFVYVVLSLEPLENNPNQIDALRRKFSSVSSVVLNDRHLENYKIPNDTVKPQHTLLFNNNLAYKKLDYLESPWIECTTSGNINFIKLHVQDEYSYNIIPRTGVPTTPLNFKAALEFADIPV